MMSEEEKQAGIATLTQAMVLAGVSQEDAEKAAPALVSSVEKSGQT